MAALAMFAAQRKGIRYVYHTLIKDPELSQAIEDETTVKRLATNHCEQTGTQRPPFAAPIKPNKTSSCYFECRLCLQVMSANINPNLWQH